MPTTGYKWDGVDLSTRYGVTVLGVREHHNLLRRKQPTEIDLGVHDMGVHAFTSTSDIFIEPRDIILEVALQAASATEFRTRWAALRSAICATGLHSLTAKKAYNTYRVYQRDASDLELLTPWNNAQNVGRAEIKLREPVPTPAIIWKNLVGHWTLESTAGEVLGTNIITVPASDSTFSSCTPGNNISNWTAYNTSTLGAGTGFITFVKTGATGGILLAPGDLTGETRHRTYKVAAQLKSSTATANMYLQIGSMAAADEVSPVFSINSTLTTYTKYLQAGTVATVGVQIITAASSSGKTITADNCYVYPVSQDDESDKATNADLYMGAAGAIYTTDRKSAANKALDFDGVNDYINTGQTFQNTFRDSFSIAFWCKPDDGQPAAVQYFCGVADGTPDNRVLLYNDTAGKLTAIYEANTNTKTAAANAATFANGAESWRHIAMVVNSEKKLIDLYKDGVKLALDSTNNGDISAVTLSAYTNTKNLFIGSYNANGTPTSPFAGPMHDFRIYARAISAEEVKVLYKLYNNALDY